VVLCSVGEANATNRVLEREFPSALFVELEVPNGQEVVFHAVAQGTSDPVCHLFRCPTAGCDETGAWVQVDYNDNHLNMSCRVAVVNNLGSARRFVAIVRSQVDGVPADISLSATVGSLSYAPYGATVGVTKVPASGQNGLITGVGETLHTAEIPGGTEWPAVIPVGLSPWSGSTDSYSWALSPYSTGGPQGGVAGPTVATGGFMLVTPKYLTDRNADGAFELTLVRSGSAMVYINDSSDADDDGVGDALEAVLMTCSDLNSCPYTGITRNPKDTDNDGLSDGEELFLGLLNQCPGGVPESAHLSLSRWGADPLRKDMFVNVNYFMPETDDVNPFAEMTQTEAKTWVDIVRGYFLADPESEIGNPDGTAGLSLHFDLGIAPSTLSDEGLFGIYPRYSSRAEPGFHAYQFLQAANGWIGTYRLVIYVAGAGMFYQDFPSGAGTKGSDIATDVAQYVNGLSLSVSLTGTAKDDSFAVEATNPAQSESVGVWLMCTEGLVTSFCPAVGKAIYSDTGSGIAAGISARWEHIANKMIICCIIFVVGAFTPDVQAHAPEQGVRDLVDSLECNIDDISLGMLVCPLYMDGMWTGTLPCAFAGELCPFILATTAQQRLTGASAPPDTEPDFVVPPNAEVDQTWEPGPPLFETLSDRLELMSEKPQYPDSAPKIDSELVEMVAGMVEQYLEMGCAEEPDSLECYYSEYSVFLLTELE